MTIPNHPNQPRQQILADQRQSRMGHAFALEGLSDFLGTMDSPHMSYGIDTDILFSIVATAHHSETLIVWNRSKKQKYMADFQYIFLA